MEGLKLGAFMWHVLTGGDCSDQQLAWLHWYRAKRKIKEEKNPLPSIPNKLEYSRPRWLTWLRFLEMWSCRVRATPPHSMALIQGKQLKPQNPFSVQTAIIPSCQYGDAEREHRQALWGKKHFKRLSKR